MGGCNTRLSLGITTSGLIVNTNLSILWSLDFGVGVFHDFSRMNFGGNELMQTNFDPSTGQRNAEGL